MQKQSKKRSCKNIERLESRLETVTIKSKVNKNQTRIKKRTIKQRNLSKTKNKKFELATIELNKILAILEDSKNEIQNGLVVDKKSIKYSTDRSRN